MSYLDTLWTHRLLLHSCEWVIKVLEVMDIRIDHMVIQGAVGLRALSRELRALMILY